MRIIRDEPRRQQRELAARVVARLVDVVVVDKDVYRRHRHRQPCLHRTRRRILPRHFLETARRRNVDGVEDMPTREETRG